MASFVSLLSFSSFEEMGIIDNQNQPLKLDWYNANDWKKFRFGIYSLDEKELPPNFDEFFAKILEQTKQFKLQLAFNKNITYPPIGIINSKSHFCNGKIIKDGPASVRGYDITSAPKVVGDTRVGFEQSHPPEGVQYKEYTSINSHDNLLNDADIVAKAFNELLVSNTKSNPKNE